MEKRNKTLIDRGIDFIDAAFVWEDPFRQERIDEINAYGEKRVQTIGKVSFGILLVVYTERVREDGNDVIRIISVRKAGRKERKERKEYEAKTFNLRRIV
jgi:uncharacterized DUF497 family protein